MGFQESSWCPIGSSQSKFLKNYFSSKFDFLAITFETNYWSFVKTNGIITPYANLTVTLQITDL